MIVFGIDIITWGIWLLGFMILLIWIYIPIKEFKKMIAERKETFNNNVNESN